MISRVIFGKGKKRLVIDMHMDMRENMAKFLKDYLFKKG